MNEEGADRAAGYADRWAKRLGLPAHRKQFLAERIRDDTGEPVDAARQRQIDHSGKQRIAKVTAPCRTVALRQTKPRGFPCRLAGWDTNRTKMREQRVEHMRSGRWKEADGCFVLAGLIGGDHVNRMCIVKLVDLVLAGLLLIGTVTSAPGERSSR